MSAVLYIRTSDSLKQALENYAAARGVSQTTAAATLIERALQVIEEEASIEQLKRKLAASAGELETTRAALHEAELQSRAAARVYKAVARRARQPLATCTKCRGPLSGVDLFVTGHCPKPGCVGVTARLAPTRGGFFQEDYLAFIGAIGGLVGLAVDTTESAP